MKKKRSKALAQLASILPPAYIIRPHTESAPLWKWYELRDAGKVEVELPPMDEENADQILSLTYKTTEVLNHHRRLKKVYSEKGEQGIKEYIVWLDAHNRRWAKRLEGIEQVPKGLLDIARSNIGSFWKMLIAFLFSFVSVFGEKKRA